MPFAGITDSNLPARIKGLSKKKKEVWVGAFNGAWRGYKKENDRQYDSTKTLIQNKESFAFRVANAAIKRLSAVTSIIDEGDNMGFKMVDIGEVSFSLKPASRVKRSALPASAFLIVRNSDVKGTWHMPIRDETGKVNVGFLRAAKQVVENRKFRGRTITFSIPAEVVAKVKRWWDQWQKIKAQAASMGESEHLNDCAASKFDDPGCICAALRIQEQEIIEAEAENFDYMSINDISGLIKNIKSSAVDSVECDYITDLEEDAFEGVVFVDSTKTIKGASIITEGWSKNEHGYPVAYLESLKEKIIERPKMFVGHVVPVNENDTANKLRRLDRPMTEWAASVANPRIEVAAKGRYKGRHQLRADLNFTEMDVGRQVYSQARKEPSSVRISINARNLMNPKGELEDKHGNVMEACVFLYSPDFVSYDSAGGGIDVTNSDLSTSEKIAIFGSGVYHIYTGEKGGAMTENDLTKLIESKISETIEKSKSRSKGAVKTIIEAFVSLQDRIRGQDLRERFCEITRFFNQIIREIIIDPNNNYQTDDSKKTAFDEATGQLKQVLFSLNLGDLKTQLAADSNLNDGNNKKKEVSNMATFEFDKAEEALKNEEIVKVFKAQVETQIPEVEVKVGDEALKVKELIEAHTKLQAEAKTLKEKANKYEAESKERTRKDKFAELVKKHKIPDDAIKDKVKATIMAAESFEVMEDLIKEFAEGLLVVAKKVRDTGNSIKEEDKEFYESINAGDNGKTSDEDFWKPIDERK